MVSVASGGRADRIAARSLFKVLRPGSGTPARYSSTFFGTRLPFAPEPRSPDLAFFMRVILQGRSLQVYLSVYRSMRPKGKERLSSRADWKKLLLAPATTRTSC